MLVVVKYFEFQKAAVAMILLLGVFGGVVLASFSRLQFDEKGSFRILQIADMHYRESSNACVDVLPSQMPFCRGGRNSTDFVRRVLSHESNIQLAIFTGDTIDWMTPLSFRNALMDATAPVRERQIPFAATLGNHDGEHKQTWSNRKLVLETLASFNGSLVQLGPSDVYGFGNYNVPIYRNSSSSVGYNLVLMDSGQQLPRTQNVSHYDWFRLSQLQWIANKLKEFPVPSSLFFHIPLQEVADMYNKKTIPIVGDFHDSSFAPALINGGLYSTLFDLQGKSMGVKSVHMGHLHVTDFCGKYFASAGEDIALCFGGGVDYSCYGRAGWPRRLRVIEIQQWGKKLVSWKRLDDDSLTKKDFQVLWEQKQ